MYFAFAFVVFAIAAIAIEQHRQAHQRRQVLSTQLGGYISMIERAKPSDSELYSPEVLRALVPLFPDSIRISILSADGHVLYDNAIADISHLESHSARPEINAARLQGEGQDIRTSKSNGLPYFYLARKVQDHYIRLALPYNQATQSELQTDRVFVYWMLVWLLLMLAIVSWVSGHLAKAIQRLRSLALQQVGDAVDIPLPKDELGEISQQIITNYQTLHRQAERIEQERERLLQHILHLPEGIGFFDKEGRVLLFNAPFLQYLSSISGQVSSSPEALLEAEPFGRMRAFVRQSQEPHYQEQIQIHAKTFELRISRFPDEGYEMILQDVTEQEHTRVLKRELTSNISHELRTPVTSIRGYLETCLTAQDMPEELRRRFIEQAHTQALLLSDLIRDISLLSHIDEGREHFVLEEIHFEDIKQTLYREFAETIAQQSLHFIWDIPSEQYIYANRHLLYAIFRNLLENTLRYAGVGVDFVVRLYHQDEHYYFFSVYDTGVGIGEAYLARIFERFYRCSEGRTRDTGGTGLGLSIVKNAVLFHKGDISVSNRAGQRGVEFLFRIARLSSR